VVQGRAVLFGAGGALAVGWRREKERSLADDLTLCTSFLSFYLLSSILSPHQFIQTRWRTSILRQNLSFALRSDASSSDADKMKTKRQRPVATQQPPLVQQTRNI
jgi:hypothetical protein